MIYLKLNKKPDTLEELFSALYDYKAEYGNDLYFYKSVETYSNEECTILECLKDKYRSLDDVVTIANTYFPEATEKEIFETLFNLKLVKEDINYYFSGINCCDIRKPTTCFYNAPNAFVAEFTEEPAYTDRSKYTWKYFFSLLGINSRSEATAIHALKWEK